jgi:hypothetical protein
MDLGMFDKFCPNLKNRAQLDERRFDMSRSDRNNERYVIPMHRKNVWTNKWMQDPRNNFLQLLMGIKYPDSIVGTKPTTEAQLDSATFGVEWFSRSCDLAKLSMGFCIFLLEALPQIGQLFFCIYLGWGWCER